MANMKCVSCGIGFFSPLGSDKCSRCADKDSQGQGHEHEGHEHEGHEHEGHDSCGCGH